MAAGSGVAGDGTNYARVRHIEGLSTVVSPGAKAAHAVEPNRPITPGDRLESAGGRAEIELADSSLIRVDRDSLVEFRTLADRRNRFERTNLLALRRGRVRIDTTDPERADAVFQIDTPAGSIYLLSAGSFRIEAAAGLTSLASFGGVAEFSGDAGSVLVRSGQSSAVPIGGAPVSPRRFNSARRDDFDRYHDGRLSAYLDAADHAGAFGGVPAGLPDEVIAAAPELAFYGTWHTLPTYGVVWRPHIAQGWAPFVHGYWGWYPAGWVWISAEPWGWTPYRYGRWDHTPAHGWFWIPGSEWSGAWVAFAVGPAQIGWCPLNYWNRPVFREPWIGAPPAVLAARLDTRAWRFVPTERFEGPANPSAPARNPRPPANSSVVLTRMLPRLDAASIGRRPDGTSPLPDLVRKNRVPLPAPATGAAPLPFHAAEARTRQAAEDRGAVTQRAPGRARPGDERAAAPSRPPRETGSGIGITPDPPPAEPPSTSQNREKRTGHAVGRLVNGARAGPPGPAPATTPSAAAPKPGKPAPEAPNPRRKPAPNKSPASTQPDAPRAPDDPGSRER